MLQYSGGTHAKACEIGSALDLASKFIRDDACRNASIQALWYSSEGATNHWRNCNSASPLHLAMYFKYAELANRLLEEGADANFQESFGMTTLMWAAHVGDLEMAKKDHPYEGASRGSEHSWGECSIHRH